MISMGDLIDLYGGPQWIVWGDSVTFVWGDSVVCKLYGETQRLEIVREMSHES